MPSHNAFSLLFTSNEWSILEMMHGGDSARLRRYITMQLYNIASEVKEENNILYSNKNTPVQRTFNIPKPLQPKFEILYKRHNYSAAEVMKKHVLYKSLSKHYNLYGF